MNVLFMHFTPTSMQPEQISVSCQTCNQYPFPQFRKWQEHINMGLRVYCDTHTTESPSFASIADRLALHSERLMEELTAVNEALLLARGLSSPMSKVPDDVLVHIFQELFSTNFNDRSLNNAPDVHPYTLVCKRWRGVLTSIGRLWNRIRVPRHLETVSVPPASWRRFFEARSDHARMLPLTLDCHLGLSSPLLGALGPSLGRITSLEISAGVEDELEETIRAISLLPNLSRLQYKLLWPRRIATYPDFEFDLFPISFNLPYSLAPSLTCADLCFEWWLQEITMPWAQLKKLKLLACRGGAFNSYTLFSELQSIEELEIDFTGGIDFHTSGCLDITLPHLRIITLTGYTGDDLPFQLLQRFKLPSLEELRFTITGRYQRLARALKTPQLSTIVKLGIDFNNWVDEDDPDMVGEIIDSLRQFKSLEVFFTCVRDDLEISERIFQGLSSDVGGEFLFPRLKLLDISNVKFTQKSLTAIQNLLQSRVSSVDVPVNARKPLREVQLSSHPFFLPNSGLRPRTWGPRSNTQISRPYLYNDRWTSVEISVSGNISRGFLEERLEGFQLTENAKGFGNLGPQDL